MTPDDTLNLLIAFVNQNTRNSTQWEDPDGGKHDNSDMSSVSEFLYDLKQYVVNVGGMAEFARLWRWSK